MACAFSSRVPVTVVRRLLFVSPSSLLVVVVILHVVAPSTHSVGVVSRVCVCVCVRCVCACASLHCELPIAVKDVGFICLST